MNVNDDRGTLAALSLVVFAACAVCAACGTESATVAAPSPSSAHSETVRGIVFPLDVFRPTLEQETLFADARRYSVASCMNKFGFDGYHRTRLPLASLPFLKDREYLFIPPSQAARYGYRWMPQEGGKTKSGPGRRDTVAQEAAVLSGDGRLKTYKGRRIPEGGCAGEAARVLTTSPDDEGLVERLENLASEQAVADRRVAAVTREWSACMRKTGHAYDTPVKAWEDARWSGSRGGGPVTPEEIATATADMRCKVEVNYLGVRATAEVEAQWAAIESHESGLRDFRQHLRIRLEKAAKVLGE